MNKGYNSGFTLVEALVVVVIIAVLAAWAIPSFLDLRDRVALRGAANDFLSTLAEGKIDATRRNAIVSVNLGATANRFPSRVSVVGTTAIGASSNTRGTVRIEPRLGALVNAADAGNYTLQSGRYQIRFILSSTAQGQVCYPGSGTNPGVPAC